MSILRVDNLTNEAGTGSPQFPSGITVTDITVDNLTVNNNLSAPTSNYRPGEIIECLSSTCNGATVEGVSGTYTWPNVTTTQLTTDTYQTLTGSNISYVPPTGTSKVKYDFTFHESSYAGGDARSIGHYRFYLGTDEIVYARHTREEDQAEDKEQHFTWTIGLGAALDTNSGVFPTWDTSKELRLEVRRYNSSYDTLFHGLYWFDGATVSSETLAIPRLTITAIA